MKKIKNLWDVRFFPKAPNKLFKKSFHQYQLASCGKITCTELIEINSTWKLTASNLTPYIPGLSLLKSNSEIL